MSEGEVWCLERNKLGILRTKSHMWSNMWSENHIQKKVIFDVGGELE